MKRTCGARWLGVIGLSQDKVKVVPYDPAWRDLYEAEAERLCKALGDRVLAVEHTGSTSVRGMDAKPIIDLMLAVESLESAEELRPALAELGYEPRDDDVPGRLFFARGPRDRRTHHLSLAELDGEFWRVQLLFRDRLRAHPHTARAYRRLKRRLAAKYAGDRPSYTAAKGEFVLKTLRQASP